MRRTHLIVAALAAAVFALAPASARAQNEKLDISAFAINMSNIATGSTAVVQINIDSWSTPEEREMLITTMVEKKPDDLLKALQKLPREGFFRIRWHGLRTRITSCSVSTSTTRGNAAA